MAGDDDDEDALYLWMIAAFQEEEQHNFKATLQAAAMNQSFVTMAALGRSLRVRHCLHRSDVLKPGFGTAWDHIFRYGGDDGLINYLGFHRTAFMQLHSHFILEDDRVHERFLAAEAGHAVVGRPTCDSYTLLAVGLFYMTNQCFQKVC